MSTNARLGTISLLLALLSGCASDIGLQEPQLVSKGELGAPVQTLEVEGKFSFLTLDDADGDGDLDIIGVSHGSSFAQVFYQTAPRQISAGPRTEAAGFHPNHLDPILGLERYYLMNAEGVNRLMVMRADPKEGLQVVAAREQGAPFSSTTFDWPGWGLSVAVSPYPGLSAKGKQAQTVWLLRGFDPGTAGVEASIPVTTPRQSVPGVVERVDLDGDGIDELVYATRRTGAIWKIAYPGEGGTPKAELIHQYQKAKPRMVVAADLNGDGAPDLAVPREVDGWIAVLYNDGKGGFVEGPGVPFEGRGGPGIIAVARDRDDSVYLVGNGPGTLGLFRFTGDRMTSYERLDLPLGRNARDFVLRDLDGDGWLDLIIAKSLKRRSIVILYGPLRENARKEADKIR